MFLILLDSLLQEIFHTTMSKSKQDNFPACVLCDSIISDEASLTSHLQSQHTEDLFHCVACVSTLALFPTYTATYQHSTKVHQVSLELAIQSSILLPSNLVSYQCKL